MRSEGSHPHKGALCLAFQDGQPGHPAPQPGGAESVPHPWPPIPTQAPRTLPLSRKAILTPWFKDGVSLGLAQPTPPEAGTEARGAQATLKKCALSLHCALSTSCPQEGLSTPTPAPHPPHLPGWRLRAPGLLTSSPVHHLLGAPLGHGFHGKRLRS